jgi:TrmH family RNA methyltransferase
MPPETSLRRVASRQNPAVARARALARSAEPGAVLVEGATLAGEAAAAGWPIDLLAVTEAALADSSIARLVDSLPRATERLFVTNAVMDAMSPVRSPSGLVAIARPPALDREVFQFDADASPALVVCAVDVQDPGNLGAIVRVAEAAGATAILAAGTSADPFGWKALRGSMGSAFRLPLVRRITLSAALAGARAAGCRIVATVLDGSPLHDVDLAAPTCLFVGSEGSGLPASVIDDADVRLAIPMERPVESLNVAVAAAVVLYEARRQRHASPARRP